MECRHSILFVEEPAMTAIHADIAEPEYTYGWLHANLVPFFCDNYSETFVATGVLMRRRSLGVVSDLE